MYQEYLKNIQKVGSDTVRYREQLVEAHGDDLDFSRLHEHSIFDLQVNYNPYTRFDDVEDLPF